MLKRFVVFILIIVTLINGVAPTNLVWATEPDEQVAGFDTSNMGVTILTDHTGDNITVGSLDIGGATQTNISINDYDLFSLGDDAVDSNGFMISGHSGGLYAIRITDENGSIISPAADGYSIFVVDDNEINDFDGDLGEAVYKDERDEFGGSITILNGQNGYSGFNFLPGRNYYIQINGKYYDVNNPNSGVNIELVRVGDVEAEDTTHSGNFAQEGVQDNNPIETQENAKEATAIEKVITFFLLVLGTGFYSIVGFALGEKVSIDDLFFNKYDNTRLGFFRNSNVPSGFLEEIGLIDVLNRFFTIFRNIVLVVYLIILIYMAIKILLGSTAGKKSKYKELLIYWVQGIAILFLFPYVMKYTIEINDAIVQYIDQNRGSIGAAASIGSIDKPKDSNSLADAAGKGDTKPSEDDASTGVGYMDQMKEKAWKEGWAIYAICWLIMIVQLITFVFIYYKRVLMVAFLISIFPIVAVYYALDKIADARAQAFGNWLKEFLLNVFMQTFHAINYVIVIGIITNLPSEGTVNWLLMLVGITYITKGESILRGIFGQVKGGGGGTVKSATESALKATAIMKATERTLGALGKPFGKGGAFSRAGAALSRISDNRYALRESRVNSFFSESAMRDDLNIASNSSLNRGQLEAIFHRLKGYANSSNVDEKAAFSQMLDDLRKKDPAKYKELERMMKYSQAVDDWEMRDKLTRPEINETIDIILTAKKMGGNYAKLVEHISEEKLKQVKHENKVLDSVKNKKKKKKSTRNVRLHRTRSGRGRSVSADNEEEHEKDYSLTSEHKKSGTQVESAPDYQSKDITNSAERRKVAKKGRKRLEYYDSADKMLFRVYGVAVEDNTPVNEVDRVRRGREKISGYTSAVNVKNEEERKFDKFIDKTSESYMKPIVEMKGYESKPLDEKVSYTIICDELARINNADSGNFTYEEIWKSVENIETELAKGYGHSADLVKKNSKVDLKHFKANLAKEMVNNSGELQGAKKKKQEMLNKAYEELREIEAKNKSDGSSGEYDYIIQDMVVSITDLIDDYEPPASSSLFDSSDSFESITAKEESALKKILKSGEKQPFDEEKAKLDMARDSYTAVKEATRGVTSVAFGSVGAFAGAAFGFAVSKEGKRTDTIGATTSVFSQIANTAADVPFKAIELGESLYEKTKEKPAEKKKTDEERAFEEGLKKSKKYIDRKKYEERLGSRSKKVVLVDPVTGKVSRESTGLDAFGNSDVDPIKFS